MKKILGTFNPAEDNSDELLKQHREVMRIAESIKKKKNKVPFDERKKANELYETAQKIEKDISLRISSLINTQKKSNPPRQISKSKAADILADYTAQEITTKFETLISLVDDLEIKYTEEMMEFLKLIDDIFIQAVSTDKDDYYKKLNELKEHFENI